MMKQLCTALLASALLFSQLGHGDQIRLLARPDEAFSGFLETLARARRTVDIATFIFEPCHSSTQVLMEKLRSKAARGVRVRVLLDGLQQSHKQELTDLLAAQGIEVRFYNANGPNRRLHVKLMLVDGEEYIAGSRNLSDEYFGLSTETMYVDSDAWVRGPSAHQAGLRFEELWNSSITKAKTPNPAAALSWEQYCSFRGSSLGTVPVEEVEAFFVHNSRRILDRHPVRDCGRVDFAADNPEFAHLRYGSAGENPDDFMNPGRMKEKRATDVLLKFIKGARAILSMSNWVYLPVYQLSDAIAETRQRRVEIPTLTNRDIEDGPAFFREAMDYALKRYAERDTQGTQEVRQISAFGAINDAHELTPPNSRFYLHSKVFIRDHKDVAVSSFNIDSRSYNTNIEATVMVYNCPAFVGDTQAQLDWLMRTYEEDVRLGRVPPKKEASPLAKAFANLTMIFF